MGNPTIINQAALAQSYLQLTSFSATSTCAGTVRFQLSPDSGSTWYFHNGSNWVSTASGYAASDTAAEVSTNIGSFHTDAGTGTLWVKTFLNSDGSGSCSIDNISVGLLD